MDRFEKKRLEKKLIVLIFGDSSDDTYGMPLTELRAKKEEEPREYDSRKARFFETLWMYFSCCFDNDKYKSKINEKVLEELYKTNEKLWKKFEFPIESEPDTIPEEYVLSYIYTSLKHIVCSKRKKNQIQTESYDYSDFAGSKIDTKETVENYHKQPIDYEKSYKELFDIIQAKFSKCQDRAGKNTKEYLSALITYRLIREEKRAKVLDELFFDIMKEYDFADKELLNELHEAYSKDLKLPKQKEIAARYVRSSTGKERKGDDAARYLRPFLVIMKSITIEN